MRYIWYVAARRLWVFDFDDTLVETDSRVMLVEGEGAPAVMSPAEFAARDQHEGDVYDFREFRLLINPRTITDTYVVMARAHAEDGPSRVIVLSARSVPDPILQYVISVGLSGVGIVALNDAAPRAKARWIENRLALGDVDELLFYDDSLRNVEAIGAIAPRHPHVRFVATHVTRSVVAV